jgi:hypothetical protein
MYPFVEYSVKSRVSVGYKVSLLRSNDPLRLLEYSS